MGFPGGSAVKNLPAMQEMQVQPMGWEDPLEEDMATRVLDQRQYSCLESPMDRGAWQATVYGVANEADTIQGLKQQQNVQHCPALSVTIY